MGDKRRFDEFARLVNRLWAKDMRIADVAGGKGILNGYLRAFGYTDVVTFDKRKRLAKPHRQHMFRYKWFSFNEKEKFDLIVAMHPDQGTDHSILYAVKNKVPFLVCPCCILPSASCFWDRKDFKAWVNHLEKLASETHNVTKMELPIAGRNLILVGKPKECNEYC